jgi:Cof subfamily protein (haloacid dehalogenase superfamily)
MSRLYVSDLDGTLLDPTGKLSDVSLDILTRLIADGLPFTVASARSVVSMREVLRGLPVRLPVVEFNGAFISELASGRHLHCESIPRAAVEGVLATGLDHGLSPVMATFDGRADHVYLLPPKNEGVAGYVTGRMAMGDQRLRQVSSLAPALDERAVCLTFMDLRENLAPLHAALARQFGDALRLLVFPEQYFPPWYWLAVYAGKATKAHALEVLVRDLGITLDEVTVFGDQVNDIPMFEECGYAVAVGNAVPELLPHADEVIGHHDTDCVAHYLAKRWGGR